MYTCNYLGTFSLIPVTLLLTISFFVLFVIRKLESKGLKNFGYVIAVLLWICALLVLSSGIYTIATGRIPMMSEMQQMMKEPMQHPMSTMPMPPAPQK